MFQVSLHRPVKYRNATGSLVVTPEAMTFSADEQEHETVPSIVEEWDWNQLEKATANKAGSKTDRLRITLKQEDNNNNNNRNNSNTVIFSFPSRQELERVKVLVKQRIKEAAATVGKQNGDNMMNDNSQSERWEDSMNVSERWPEPVELQKIEEVVEEEEASPQIPTKATQNPVFNSSSNKPEESADARTKKRQSASSLSNLRHGTDLKQRDREEDQRRDNDSNTATSGSTGSPPPSRKQPPHKNVESDSDDFSAEETRQTQRSTRRPSSQRKRSSYKGVDSDDDDFSADTRQTHESKRVSSSRKQRNSYSRVDTDDDDFSADTRQTQRSTRRPSSQRKRSSYAYKGVDSCDNDDFSADTWQTEQSKRATSSTRQRNAKKYTSGDSDDDDDFSAETRQSNQSMPRPKPKTAHAYEGDDDSQFSNDTLSMASIKSQNKTIGMNISARGDARREWLPKPIQEQEGEEEQVVEKTRFSNHARTIPAPLFHNDETFSSNNLQKSSSMYAPQAGNQSNGTLLSPRHDEEVAFSEPNDHAAANTMEDKPQNSLHDRWNNLSLHKQRQIMGGCCCCCCCITIIVIIQIVARVVLVDDYDHDGLRYFQRDYNGIVVRMQSFRSFSSDHAMSLCEQGTQTPTRTQFYEPNGMIGFGEPRAEVNCNSRKLEIEDGRKLDLPACYLLQENEAGLFDCLDEDVANNGQAFLRQVRYSESGCSAVRTSNWFPIGPYPTEVCWTDSYEEMVPSGGSFKASCVEVPAKLVVHRWLENNSCNGRPDLTSELSLDEGACEPQTYWRGNEVRYVESKCSK
ncbi:expressed unknown protein [Seminavis robusta]|uniref:Uncharacterized protein n=1 Tax=Seminavis robusta TaxID=568900 RepID=A0A9N8E9U0_9STRA|nr:expressed unknown protein [Seminavis robusta]|eukprot:Sro666_g184080.1 n/a (802) ;mRNA; r:49910-52315